MVCCTLQVIQHWKDEWTSNTTIDEFKQVLDTICRRLDAKNVEHCLHIVDDYYVPFFNYIAHELDPTMVCQTVGLCGNGDILKVRRQINVFRETASRN